MIAFFAAVLLLTGCETERTDQARIEVTPREAVLRPGGSVTLRATGWHSYSWTLADPGLGYLSAATGDTTTYTRTSPSDSIQIVTIRTEPGDVDGAIAPVASVIIRSEQGRVRITPDRATIRVGRSVTFQASGWHAYTWEISDPNLGFLSSATGHTTTYTSLFDGDAYQIITVSIASPGGTNATTVAASALITHR